MIRFVNREEEIKVLEEAAKSSNAEFIVIYGRRRVGKTRLIVEFLKGKDGIFYIAEDASKRVQIREIKEKIAEYFNDKFLRNVEIGEWEELFEYLKKILPRDRRIYFVIDEFSYLVKNSPEIVSVLQKFWDTFASSTKIFILLSGSLLGLMSERVLSHSSPLYGRRTRDILLNPLNLRNSCEFLRMRFEDKLRVYMSIGGVPEYLLRASKYKTSNDFFRNEFFSKYGYFYREPYFLLSQEFREIKTYFAILNAISYGHTRGVEIANFVGINTREIYPYLENLLRLGLVTREISLLGNKKSGRYTIGDPFIDFWFNFVYENRESIEQNNFEIKERNLNRYFGKRFEIIVRKEIFPLISSFKQIGRWWYKDEEIDIVAINDATEEIWFGECKWRDNVDASRILNRLQKKAKKVNWKNEKRMEYYVIFAKSFKKRVENCICVDLEDLRKLLFQDNKNPRY